MDGMLTKHEFLVLDACRDDSAISGQRDVARRTNLSLGTVNSACKRLAGKALLDESYRVTPAGMEALEPY